MKGGKGGTGRKHTARPAEKSKNPHDGPKRGAPKKDWGAIERDSSAASGSRKPGKHPEAS